VATKVDTPLVGRSSATGGAFRIRRTNVPEADAQGFFRQIGEGESSGLAWGGRQRSVVSGTDMHTLLVVTAVLEGLTGLALVAFPSRLATLLLGSSLDAPAALTLARVAGVALVALALTCWLTRHDGQGRAARGLVAAMALYHTGVAVVLAHASIGLALSGLGLWPTVLFHAAMTAWCLKTSR
jgi:hypothetical protein